MIGEPDCFNYYRVFSHGQKEIAENIVFDSTLQKSPKGFLSNLFPLEPKAYKLKHRRCMVVVKFIRVVLLGRVQQSYAS